MEFLNDIADLPDLTSSLKRFFRDLKEPLIPWSITKNLLAIEKEQIENAEKIIRFKQQIQNPENGMPDSNHETLKYLLQHLLKVNESPNNKMDAFNLGVIFGPTLMWNSESNAENSLNLALDLMGRSTIAEILLLYFNDIFC